MADKYQEVTGDGPTLKLLERIQNKRALIHVRVREKSNPWSSAIIAVDHEQHTWQFDELSIAEGHRLLLKERRCEIETRLDGIIVKFQVEGISSGVDKKGLGYYEARAPQVIRIYQRRSNFRAMLDSSQRATLRFIIPGVAVMRGRIRDISEGGVGADFSSWTQVIESGLYIPNSTLTFPDNKSVTCELKVCFARRSVLGMSMGARFVKMSKEDQRQISQFVMLVDRERAKRNWLKS